MTDASLSLLGLREITFAGGAYEVKVTGEARRRDEDIRRQARARRDRLGDGLDAGEVRRSDWEFVVRPADRRVGGDGPQLVELGPDERVEFAREVLRQLQNLDEF